MVKKHYNTEIHFVFENFKQMSKTKYNITTSPPNPTKRCNCPFNRNMHFSISRMTSFISAFQNC